MSSPSSPSSSSSPSTATRPSPARPDRADPAGRRGTLRTRGANGIIELTTPQKLMVFVLSMSLFGLSNIMLELIPDIQVGPVDIYISNMIFIPLTMAVLLSPF